MFTRLLLTVALVCLSVPAAVAEYATLTPFPDVRSLDDNARAIVLLQKAGFFSGYADGSFRPQSAINRAEFLKIMLLSINVETLAQAKPKNCFPDVRIEDWFSPYVCLAAEKGWVRGYDDGTFRPAQAVNLAEALKMIVTIRQYALATLDAPAIGYDHDAWYAPYVDTMIWKDAFSLETLTNDVALDEPMTRQLAAEILYRAMLDDGRISYNFDASDCDFATVTKVSLRQFDLKTYADMSFSMDFDILGQDAEGKQCTIATFANPYAGVSRHWTSRTMFLVSAQKKSEILELAPVGKDRTVWLRAGHATAGLGSDLWLLDLSTRTLTPHGGGR